MACRRAGSCRPGPASSACLPRRDASLARPRDVALRRRPAEERWQENRNEPHGCPRPRPAGSIFPASRRTANTHRGIQVRPSRLSSPWPSSPRACPRTWPAGEPANDGVDQRADAVPAARPGQLLVSMRAFKLSVGEKSSLAPARPGGSGSSAFASLLSSPLLLRRGLAALFEPAAAPSPPPSLQPLLGRIMAPLSRQISAQRLRIELFQPCEHVRVIPVMVGEVECSPGPPRRGSPARRVRPGPAPRCHPRCAAASGISRRRL